MAGSSRIEQAMELSRQGLKAAEIAKRLNLSHKYVLKIAQYNSLAEFRAARAGEIRTYRRRTGALDKQAKKNTQTLPRTKRRKTQKIDES